MTAKNKTYLIYLIPALILLVPFIAMQFTSEVDWSAADFIIAAVLLFGSAYGVHLVTKKLHTKKSKIILISILLILLLLTWAELAVGIFGTPIAGS